MKRVSKVSEEILPSLYSSHPSSSETTENERPEEDLSVLMHCFPTLECLFYKWMINDRRSKAYYGYHQKYFTILQLHYINNNSNVCWLWKAPAHILFLDSLIEAYPDVRLIITHRHLSQGKLYATILRAKQMYGTLPVKEIGSIAFHICIRMINRLDTSRFFLENNPNVIHIHYSDLMNNPIDCINRLYHHFGLIKLSTELMTNFQLQSKQNLQEKYSQMTYDLDEFGLIENEIQKEFSSYISWLQTISNSFQQS